ncbi:Lrp/AsnC family transcriptional regulator [Kibdelosporangium lantanae]|uniref:Lrp/AsnC family transcriptional regulator n=1 Tax=Kibdelosporangium lantanae TaxID=1497396 RepID=A0ABW3MJP0_9PSEU
MFDSTDREILRRLQVDGRVANVDLAEAVRLSPSACLRRVRALEDAGVIAGYRAELDRDRVGLGLTVFLELKVQGHSAETKQMVEDALLAIPAVVACHLVSGTADFFVEGAVPDLASYEDSLLDHVLAIPAVVDIRSTFAIRTMRTRGPLPVDGLG